MASHHFVFPPPFFFVAFAGLKRFLFFPLFESVRTLFWCPMVIFRRPFVHHCSGSQPSICCRSGSLNSPSFIVIWTQLGPSSSAVRDLSMACSPSPLDYARQSSARRRLPFARCCLVLLSLVRHCSRLLEPVRQPFF